MNFLENAKQLQEQIVHWRRELHKIPEVGLILPQTAAFVQARLTEMGIPFQTFDKHSGIVAIIGKKEGRVVAIRADMDALPIVEQVDVPYKSQNQDMHACGHDAHTAILLATAKILKEHEEQLEGKIKLIFQPAEEGPGGAEPMVKDGVLENPRPDAILALHLMPNVTGTPDRLVRVSYSNMWAADDQMRINITGVGSHGSQPENAIDPVIIATQIVNGLQLIVSRELSPLNPGVITVAGISAGRGAYNIIPESAEIIGTIRVVDMDTRAFVLNRIETVAKGIAQTYRAECEVQFLDGYPALINNQEVTERFLKSAAKIVPENEIEIMNKPVMGGEDAAFFFQEIPGTYFFLDVTPEEGKVHPLHSPYYHISEKNLHLGTALFTQAAFDLLKA